MRNPKALAAKSQYAFMARAQHAGRTFTTMCNHPSSNWHCAAARTESMLSAVLGARRCAPAVPRVVYVAALGEWSLCWPCEQCGGVTLRLYRSIDVSDLGAEVLRLVDELACGDCPRCAGEARPGGRAYFDAALGDWVKRVRDGRVVRLNVPWFDYPSGLLDRIARCVR